MRIIVGKLGKQIPKFNFLPNFPAVLQSTNGNFSFIAHKMSQVSEQIAGLTSYSGFFTVNETYNGNIFFWFFPAQVSTQHLYIYHLVVPCGLVVRIRHSYCCGLSSTIGRNLSI